MLHPDNGAKFLSLTSGLNMKAVNIATSSVYAPNSNVLTERINKTLLQKERAMMRDRSVRSLVSVEAISYASELQNYTAKTELNMKTATKALMGNSPKNWKLRTFGCAAFLHSAQGRWARKLHDRAEKDIHMSTRHGIHGSFMGKTKP